MKELRAYVALYPKASVADYAKYLNKTKKET